MISKNFARCLAKISGDGNLYKHYIRYSNTSDILRDEFIEDIKQEFGNITFTKGVGNSGTPFVQIHGKNIINKFLTCLPSFKSSDIFVPLIIKNSTDDIIQEYIRVLYDDEGCVALRLFRKTNEWKRNITLASNSLYLLIDIKQILNSYNIMSNRIIKNNNHRIDDKSYILSITGKENIINFSKNISFKHPDKLKRIKLMIKSYEATSKNKKEFEKIKMELSIP